MFDIVKYTKYPFREPYQGINTLSTFEFACHFCRKQHIVLDFITKFAKKLVKGANSIVKLGPQEIWHFIDNSFYLFKPWSGTQYFFFSNSFDTVDTFHLQRFRHYQTITLCNYAKSPFYFHGVFHSGTPHGNKRVFQHSYTV